MQSLESWYGGGLPRKRGYDDAVGEPVARKRVRVVDCNHTLDQLYEAHGGGSSRKRGCDDAVGEPVARKRVRVVDCNYTLDQLYEAHGGDASRLARMLCYASVASPSAAARAGPRTRALGAQLTAALGTSDWHLDCAGLPGL